MIWFLETGAEVNAKSIKPKLGPFTSSTSRALKMKNFSNSTCYIIINITIKNTDTITIIHLSRIDLFLTLT